MLSIDEISKRAGDTRYYSSAQRQGWRALQYALMQGRGAQDIALAAGLKGAEVDALLHGRTKMTDVRAEKLTRMRLTRDNTVTAEAR